MPEKQQRLKELNLLIHGDYKKLASLYRKAIGMPPGPTPTPVATSTVMINAILEKEFPEKNGRF